MPWQRSQSFPDLRTKEVHVWRASLKYPQEKILEFLKILNLQERERAAKFMVNNAASSFIIARGILRTLLAKYLNLQPQEIIFRQNQYGKLYLESSPLQFNLSHSHEIALFIFALNTPVGIDVEFMRVDYNFTDIAQRFFSKVESEKLFALPKDKQLQAFFNCWVRKEAVIKAQGVGMFKELDKFSVEVSSSKEGCVQLLLDDDSDQNWTLESLNPGGNYSGAFAIGLTGYTVNFYDF
ncbi:MAG: 4'-phosphopantetheinyl transferase superfamily protein [Coxiellaceae bacterium]|jgi:4'-phosphopantetheinyl transferase|nr:4'-phosphopantetheinyl transferase superfamily protein [Coxiellaceae bacterium]